MNFYQIREILVALGETPALLGSEKFRKMACDFAN